MSKKVGYARVSTKDQNLSLQIEALHKEGCDKIFTETQSSAKDLRALEKALEYLRSGDTFVVWKIDRLGRSLKQLIEKIEFLRANEIDFVSISDRVDTTTPMGNFFFQICACFAEYEREIIRERTRSALKVAKEQGRTGGRPTGISTRVLKLGKKAKELYASGNLTTREISEMLGISPPTLFKILKELDTPLKTK